MDLLTDTNEIVEDNEIRQKAEIEINELKNFTWEEKYRPRTLDEVILPDSIKNLIKYSLKEDSLQNMIFYSSSPGTGKTTVAKVIPEEYGCDYMFVRTAAEGRMDLVETAIPNYGMQKLGDSKPRFVIFDEGDRVRAQSLDSFYGALQPTIEATRSTLRFIITVNNLHLIPEAIRSRCKPIDFNHNDDSIKKPMWDRLKYIAETETAISGGELDINTLKQIAKLHFPDMRSMISAMQHNFNVNQGSIKGDISSISQDYISEIWNLVKKGDIMKLRKYYTEHINDINGLYVPFEQYASEHCDKKHILSIAVVIAEHQYKSAYDQVDPELNINGMFAKIIKLIHV